MSRYIIGKAKQQPRNFDIDDDCPLIPDLTADEHEAVDTGLISPTGEPIMRLPERMGFHNPRGDDD